jgi:membrane protein DedA with SNARE-associated domain
VNLPDLIEQYGYWVVFAGTLLEGESVLLLAGFAAYLGILELHIVVGVAVLGSFLGDQLWFLLGRTHGAQLLARFPKYTARAARAEALLAKYHTPIILAVRFLYGLRIVLPFTLGMSSVPTLRFQVLNFIGAVLWAASGAAVGYLFGNAIETVLGDIHRYERYLFAFLALAGLGYWWYTVRHKA